MRFTSRLASFGPVVLSFLLQAFAQTVPYPPTPLVKMAVNPVTNKVYVANEFSDSVTVLDAASNTMGTIAVGPRPQFIAVNPLTNRVYVNNAGNATLTVIDGATDTNLTPAPLALGSTGPISINTKTNVVYVVRLTGPGSDEVTFFNATSNTWYSIATESFQPTAMAVNPVTDKIYIAHYATGDVRVISGAFNPALDFPPTFSIGAWSRPFAIAANPVTNKVYVITEDARGPIGIIDGANNTAVFTVPAAGHGQNPKSIAVNPVTNRIYAAFKDEVILIDGNTGAYTYIDIGATGTGPVELGINHVTNKIYVAKNNGTLVVIDGDTNATTSITIPAGAVSVGVNPLTNKTYVFGPTTTIIAGGPGDTVHPNPLVTTIGTLPSDTSGPNPSFTLTAASGFSPNAPQVRRVYYQLDSTAGAWTAASGSGPYSASFTALPDGAHTLYAFATDGQDAPIATGAQSIPFVGNVASYRFTVGSAPPATATVSIAASRNPTIESESVTFTASVTGSAGTPGGGVDFLDGSVAIPGCAAVALSSGSATCATASLSPGTHPVSARYSGNASYAPATSSTVSQVVNASPPGLRATDLNADGRSDILYRNSATGEVYRLLMNGFTVVGAGAAYREPDTAWKIVGDADFDGDGVVDLLWRNDSTAQVYFMPFDSTGRPRGGSFVAASLGTAWKVVQTPDLDGDGKADIVWWNASTGEARAMLMNGAAITMQATVYTEPNTAWKIVAAGDFSGIGRKSELVWRNASTGEVYLMKVSVAGAAFTQSGQMIYGEPDTAWKIVAAADFNGDGKSDLLWRNDATGQVFMMLMNGASPASQGTVHVEPNLAWKIVAQGDYDADGKADILWRNDATGQVYMMLMNGLAISAQRSVYAEANTSWKVMGAWEYGRASGTLPP